MVSLVFFLSLVSLLCNTSAKKRGLNLSDSCLESRECISQHCVRLCDSNEEKMCVEPEWLFSRHSFKSPTCVDRVRIHKVSTYKSLLISQLGETCHVDTNCLSRHCVPECHSDSTVWRCTESKSFYSRNDLRLPSCVGMQNAVALSSTNNVEAIRNLGELCTTDRDCISNNCVTVCNDSESASICIENRKSFELHNMPAPECISKEGSIELINNIISQLPLIKKTREETGGKSMQQLLKPLVQIANPNLSEFVDDSIASAKIILIEERHLEKEKQRIAEEEKRRQELERKRVAEEKRQQELGRKRIAEEEKRQQELERKRVAEEEKRQQELERKRVAEEEKKKRVAEEEENIRFAVEKERIRIIEEQKKRIMEEETKRIVEEEEKKRVAEEEQERQQELGRKRVAAEEEMERIAVEEEKKRIADEEERRRVTKEELQILLQQERQRMVEEFERKRAIEEEQSIQRETERESLPIQTFVATENGSNKHKLLRAEKTGESGVEEIKIKVLLGDDQDQKSSEDSESENVKNKYTHKSIITDCIYLLTKFVVRTITATQGYNAWY